MTAGNLFCGFSATLKIFEGTLLQAVDPIGATGRFHHAIWYILFAFVFDMLDGRIARLGGQESAFGREFDSLADVISFGVAPALLVFQIILQEFDWVGRIIAFFYLTCGALRLARFNCMVAENCEAAAHSDFEGIPTPAAAGFIASLTLTMLWLESKNVEVGKWQLILPPLMLFLSLMMFSSVRYPSFKAINWRTQRSLPMFLCIILLIVLTLTNYEWMPTAIFLVYMLYGLIRPWLSKKMRHNIEIEIGEELPSEDTEE